MRRTYFSLEAFYATSAARAASREMDLGLYWRDGRDGPTYRAAWIRDTGEVYVVSHGLPQDGGGRVEVIAHCATEAEVEASFAGWRDVCESDGSMAWLRRHALQARLRWPVRIARPAAR
jgi:hypothetical protein